MVAFTEWTGGLSWIADPDERSQRASHALRSAAGVWIVDPVDADGLDDRLAALGELAGVLVLHDRHTRDAATVARRHDIPVLVPDWMALTREKLETTAEPTGDTLPGTGYDLHPLIDRDDWEETVLVNETATTVVVPEALGTIGSFLEGEQRLGIHPALEKPPSGLEQWTPDRVLVGHGSSIHEEAGSALEAAIAGE